MISQETIELLAKRYAQAFMRVYDKQVTFADVETLHAFILYGKRCRSSFSILSLPSLSDDDKINVLRTIMQRLKVSLTFMPIVELLVISRRINILFLVCAIIQKIYYMNHRIMRCRLKSMPDLSEEQSNVIARWIEHKTGYTVLYSYERDSQLIAGMRVESDTIVWEHSIQKQLRLIRRVIP